MSTALETSAGPRVEAAPAGAATMLSVVIVTYDGAGLVEECLHSVAEHCPGAEVLVVDNASRDDTLERVRRDFPEVQVVPLRRNLGYGAAANAGVALSSGRYCLILNQDLTLTSSLRPALEAMHRDPRSAVTGGRLHFPDGRPQLTIGFERTAARVLLSWLIPPGLPLVGRWASRMETRSATYAHRAAGVAWVSGALLLCRTSAWHELGGMDASLFMYCEDIEFCKRVREAGLRVDYEPQVRAVHAEASGKSWVGVRALDWTMWNDVELLRRRRGAACANVLRLALAGACGLRACAFRILSAVRGAPSHADKARGYWTVAGNLLRGQAARQLATSAAPLTSRR